MRSRAELLEDLAAAVSELTDAVSVVVEVEDWWPTREHPDWAHAGSLPHRPERRVHRHANVGLLAQLTMRRRAVLRPPQGAVDASWLLGSDAQGSAPTDSPIGRGSASSRPPCDLSAADLLGRVAVESFGWWQRLDGGRQRATLPATIRGLVGLGASCDVPTLGDLCADVQAWRRQARLILGYEVPAQKLRMPCPDCGGELRWRPGDNVKCAGLFEGPALEGERWPVRCGAEWPRSQWLVLLDASGL